MSAEIKGNIGSSPVEYDVKADNSLDLSVTISYARQAPTDPQFSIMADVPLEVVLNALVGQKGGILGEAELLLVQAAEAYLKSQPA